MPSKFIRVDRLRCYCIAFLVVSGFACEGCGSKSPLATVRGKVELNGRPLASGNVMTLPKGGRGARAAILNGEFELGTFGKNDGALIGIHKVAVVAFEEGHSTGPEAKVGKLLVPERYTNPESSGLSIEVKADGPNEPVLELTSP